MGLQLIFIALKQELDFFVFLTQGGIEVIDLFHEGGFYQLW